MAPSSSTRPPSRRLAKQTCSGAGDAEADASDADARSSWRTATGHSGRRQANHWSSEHQSRPDMTCQSPRDPINSGKTYSHQRVITSIRIKKNYIDFCSFSFLFFSFLFFSFLSSTKLLRCCSLSGRKRSVNKEWQLCLVLLFFIGFSWGQRNSRSGTGFHLVFTGFSRRRVRCAGEWGGGETVINNFFLFGGGGGGKKKTRRRVCVCHLVASRDRRSTNHQIWPFGRLLGFFGSRVCLVPRRVRVRVRRSPHFVSFRFVSFRFFSLHPPRSFRFWRWRSGAFTTLSAEAKPGKQRMK